VANYGPYGQKTGIPQPIGGIDGGNSLLVESLVPDALTGSWRPRLHPGRYYVSSEKASRYRYAKHLTVSQALTAGQMSLTVSVDIQGPEALSAPILVSGLTQVSQTIRFAQPVPPTNIVLAGNFIAQEFLQDPTSPSQTSAITWNDSLWWMPLFGGDVLTVHQSRRPRSIDVLADSDAILYRVETPDQLSDSRCYCVDFESGIVYGKVPANFPDAPFGTGLPPMTYVTVAYPPESDPSLGLLTDYSEWSTYFSDNAAFFTAYEGLTSELYFNPLRLEEICLVDTDGLIRLSHGPVSTVVSPSVVLIGPSGPVVCSIGTVQGSSLSPLLPDPTHSGSLSRLPYGTTVLARYFVDNSFAIIGIGNDQLRLKTLVPVAVTAIISYEGDPHGLAIPTLEAPGPDLNPLTRAVCSGFLWYENGANPLPVPIGVTASIQVSNTQPIFDPVTGAGEIILIRAALLDPTDTPISGADLHLWCNPSASVAIEYSDVVSGDDGISLFRARLVADSAGLPITFFVSDGRTIAQPLGQINLLPITEGTRWEPSVFVALCEDYISVGVGAETLTRRIVRVSVTSPDGFPWRGPAPSQIVLTSSRSTFYAPQGQTDALVGSSITLSCDSVSDEMSSSAVLTAGYAPVSGDTLTATFYTGDSRYRSCPLKVN